MFHPTLSSCRTLVVTWTSGIVLLGAAWTAASQSPFGPSRSCRCFPGDQCWPSAAEWDSFNQTVGGRLIQTVPVASPCHDTFPGVSFDNATCADIRSSWARPASHYETSHSPMAAIFANGSCDPFTDRAAQCVTGSYVQYAVNATGPSDYIATLAFVSQQNIRLVIRNTGHDYLGKSTGAGSLALWTHHLKDIAVLDYSSDAYTGKAMRVQAGVQAFEAQSVAHELGLVVVEGACPSVGIAGGYTQGGGTSPLGSRFGLAADQVLEWEVVTPTGQILIATPDQNSDLYWALSGGGGGTYGVVLSMTVKLHPDLPTGGATLTFTEPTERYWDALQAFLVSLPAIVDAGAVVYWQVVRKGSFNIPQSYLPNGTAQDMERLFQPTLIALNQSGITYGIRLFSYLQALELKFSTVALTQDHPAFSSHTYPTFRDAANTMNPQMNVNEINIGGRLIPASLASSESSAARLIDAIKYILDNRGIFAGVSQNVSMSPTVPNSVHPYWRETLFLAFIGIMYDRYNLTANHVARATVTNTLVPALAELTPNGAAYLNEADVNEPQWQEAFYGSNYPRLLSIKQKYDPNDVLWAKTAVGSEGWDISADGRLCEV